jgi:uncharacterized membrane-anchored protein YitT (DUF2179 family)
MKKNKISKLTRDWKSYLLILIGDIFTAMSLNMFLVPNRIAAGGLSGVSTIIFHLLDFPVGTTMLVLNIPLFILGVKYIGRLFGFKTIFATLMLSLIVDFSTFMPVITKDVVLASLYGGILMGVGLGMVLRAGATTGGTDLAAKILNKFFPVFSIGQLLLAMDIAIIMIAGLVFNNFELSLYAAVTLYISSKIIDGLLEGVDFAKGVFIVSTKSERISEAIMKKLDRGLTGLKGKGMYTSEDKTVLMCVLRRWEIPTLKKIVGEIDDKAFVMLTDVREVLGEGFKGYE